MRSALVIQLFQIVMRIGIVDLCIGDQISITVLLDT